MLGQYDEAAARASALQLAKSLAAHPECRLLELIIHESWMAAHAVVRVPTEAPARVEVGALSFASSEPLWTAPEDDEHGDVLEREQDEAWEEAYVRVVSILAHTELLGVLRARRKTTPGFRVLMTDCFGERRQEIRVP